MRKKNALLAKQVVFVVLLSVGLYVGFVWGLKAG